MNELEKQAFTSTRANSKLYPADGDVFQDYTSSTNDWRTGRKRRCRGCSQLISIFSLSDFQLMGYTKLPQASKVPLSFRTCVQLQSLRPTAAVASLSVSLRAYFLEFRRSRCDPTGETLQKCPATGTPPSASCRTRHWSMLWQVQWWAKPKCHIVQCEGCAFVSHAWFDMWSLSSL